MRLWYLRRAVPWAALLGGLVAAAGLVGLTRAWEGFTGLGLPLAALLAASCAAFVFDEPAVAVTAVTPRGSRWGRSARLALAGLPVLAGSALLAAAPGDTDLAGWTVVVLGLGGTVALLALAGSVRQLARPGSAVASAAVLLGMTPIVLGLFLDFRSPYPLPPLTDGLTAFWGSASTISVLACAVLLSRPLRPPTSRRRTTRGAPSDVPGVPMNVTTPGASR